MKKKIHKILGVGLTLVLLLSLTVALTPLVSADELAWSKMSFPKEGSTGDYFCDSDIDGFTAFAKAIDGTLYAYVNGLDLLLQSTDDGRSWSNLSKYTGVDIVDMATSSDDADILYVATVADIYKTPDAGSSFTKLSNVNIVGTITSIDVGYVGGDAIVFVGTATGTAGGEVYSLNEATYGASWQDSGRNLNVFDIRTSPNFDAEANPQIVAVVSDGTANTWVSYKYGSAVWDTTVSDVLLDSSTGGAFAMAVGDGADIAFPGDYDSDSTSGELEFFVAIDDSGGGGAGVYRIIVSSDFAGTFADDFTSVDVAGEVGDVSLLAGTDAGSVYRSTDGTGGTWSAVKKAPTGDGDTYVLLADDYLETEEGLVLASGTNAALSLTLDGGVTFTDISLIDSDIKTVNDVALGSNYVAAEPNSGNDNLWRYDGTYWERVDNATNIDRVAISADGDAVFWADATPTTAPQIYRSTDDGTRFIAQLAAPDNFHGWVVIDKSTIIVGGATGDNAVFKTSNNGTTWSKKTSGLTDAANLISFALSPDFDNDDTILAGDDTAAAGQIFRSTDGGVKWKEITTGTFGGTNSTYVAFDPDYADNETFYAVAKGAIERYTTKWESITGFVAGSTTAISVGTPSGLVCSPDGTLYFTESAGVDGMQRSLNPTTATASNVEWENVTKDITSGVKLDSLQLTTGSNILWGHDGADVWTYEDTLTGSPSLVGPSDRSTTGRVTSATLTWSAMDGAKKYEIRINTREDFKGTTTTNDDVSVTSTSFSTLSSGKTYYWKVRVSAGDRLLSNWSSVWSFTTAMGAAQWNPFVGGVPETPSNGATGVALTPTFAWNAADWATGYEFVLADNAGFSSPITSKTLDGTVYVSEEELDNDTTYYWKVRAKSATSQSEWGTAVFTTKAKAVAPPAPAPPATVTQPAPAPIVLPTPIPPALLWTIIGIGALLIIAVIVLIVRTRRPV